MSNFQPPHLRRIIDETGVTPAVNQVELHPRFQQAGLRREHEELGIVTEAWSPLAKGRVARPFGERPERFDHDPVGQRFFGDGDRAIVEAAVLKPATKSGCLQSMLPT